MDTLLAMVAKDFKLLLRDRMGGFFTFGFPIVMAIFFGTLFSGGSSSGPAGGIKLAVVDEDTTTVSRTFADSLAASPELRVTRMTLAEAENAVKLGRQTAFVRLPSGFGAARGRTFAGGGPEVELGMDPSRRAESGMLQGVLMKRAARDTFMQSNASKRPTGSTGAAGGFEPLRFRSRDIARQVKGPRNAYEISFPQGVMWAVVSCALGFALGLVNERQRGTLIRLRVAPLERWRILGGKALGCFLTILMLASVVLLVGRLGFGVRPASFPLLVASLLSISFAFVGVMMAISTLGKTQAAVSGLGWAILMMMNMTGGGMVPLAFMPAWMQSAGSVSPVKWAILSLEGSMWRGFSAEQMLLPCGILLAVGAVGLTIGVRAFRWNEA